MAAKREPRILHFHDCADVGGALVRAAKRQGIKWDYLNAEKVRPSNLPTNKWLNRLFRLPVMARNYRYINRADLLHIHYAMVVPEAQMKPMPQRPYFLHLHGTDIRKHWAGLRRQSRVQRYIDGAEAVFFTNLDTAELALEARSDAQFMPAFIELDRIKPWSPNLEQEQKIIFLSRWEEVKGLERQLELVKALRTSFPKIRLEGLDWGVGASEAAALGVNLVPKMTHAAYIDWISKATLAIGQANVMLGVSEFEAIAMGIPVAVLGHRLPRLDDGTTPPVIEGTVDEVISQIQIALANPLQVETAHRGRDWVLTHHLADPYVPILQEQYLRTLGL
ncbi:MAG: glycosyltransferase [Arcanobacterium sp.]|nr:glycosyltransferase [Arcanobacterium sp.]